MHEHYAAEIAAQILKDKLSFSRSALGGSALEQLMRGADIAGDNALKHVLGQFGIFDAGFLDAVEFDARNRNLLLAHTYQETVACYA
ncbi:hypothetical protein [Rhodobacter lacus]|uniref:Uncharacterized protein n=1 Tax=Rhodobacter lacus TaxID=1641972 RepID=A0ABW5ABU2_9RHOB